MYIVDWSEPSLFVLMSRGHIGEVRREGGAFIAELRGLADRLAQRILLPVNVKVLAATSEKLRISSSPAVATALPTASCAVAFQIGCVMPLGPAMRATRSKLTDFRGVANSSV